MEILHIPDQFQHLTVEIAQEMVLQIQVVHQIPLAASVFIRPSIALPREVDPFRMPELISHKVQITAINSRSRNQTDHLMQGDTSIYHEIMVIFLHMPIHIGVDQAEDDRLITHQGLIVALGITDRLLIGTTVRRLPPDRRRMPILIFLFLDRLDPIVRDVHSHAIIKAITTILYLSRQTRHATHLLGDRYSARIHLMDQFIGQG